MASTLPSLRARFLRIFISIATVSTFCIAAGFVVRIAHSSLNLTASLAPDMQRQWSGQPEMMEALLRHLLLIALKRTRSGFVCMRLEAYPHRSPHVCCLRIALQDSGAHVQHWQLQHWLSLPKDETPSINMAGEISWLLAVRLLKRLGGTLTGAGGEQNGLSLEGSVPLSLYDTPFNNRDPSLPDLTPALLLPPLVLAIENDKESHDSTSRLLMEEGCTIFMVNTHQEALEWASLLPFSLIILNAGLVDGNQDVTRRLRHMMEDGMIPNIPLWMMTSKFSFIDFDYWRQQGISELLLKPILPESLRQLLLKLPERDGAFYLAQHQLLHQDMLPSRQSLTIMNQMLAEQIIAVTPVIQALAKNQIPKDGRNLAHAVRSAALTLGYFRLAALMGQIEHAAHSGKPRFPARNWEIVLEILQSTGFENA